ncbi:hypothetical protein PUN28_015774 [Cardiocondyla obscurior]|uniref:Uncharacterized protein n=1 Tax=Cardiocondyla obscurior TaxID=286306 RepID=A0AAW2EUN5_9HYME
MAEGSSRRSKKFNQVKINLKDLGRKIKIPMYHCSELEQRFKITPWQAIGCSIARIQPLTGKGWTQKNIDMVKFLVEGYKVWIKIEECLNEEKAAVKLIRAPLGSEEALDIGKELIKRGDARYINYNYLRCQIGMVMSENNRFY